MNCSELVCRDIAWLRSELRSGGEPLDGLLELNFWRPLLDIVFDWTMVLCCVAAVRLCGGWCIPLCLLLIGNRQRAMGNMLHEAAHRNLSRKPWLNDGAATLLLAPALFSDLALYRRLHVRHHRDLGDSELDPDYIRHGGAEPSWRQAFLDNWLSLRNWRAVLIGDLGVALGARRNAFVFVWWGVVCGLQAVLVDIAFAREFIVVWLLARTTSYNAISAFRELCDHFGLPPGGVFAFTRDIVARGPMRDLIHPRNDGYHLSHHLMPAVPYYRLPAAHARFFVHERLRRRACICHTYFSGGTAVVRRRHPAAAREGDLSGPR